MSARNSSLSWKKKASTISVMLVLSISVLSVVTSLPSGKILLSSSLPLTAIAAPANRHNNGNGDDNNNDAATTSTNNNGVNDAINRLISQAQASNDTKFSLSALGKMIDDIFKTPPAEREAHSTNAGPLNPPVEVTNSTNAGLPPDLNNNNNNNDATTTTIKVAFVRPSFTYAAYTLGAFYDFYQKYESVPPGSNVTTDLNMLTAKIPGPNEQLLNFGQHPGDVPDGFPEKDYMDKLLDFVKSQTSNSNVVVDDITDKEVNDGQIFKNAAATDDDSNSSNNSSSNNSTNAYNVLFLFHQEYVTAKEYYNLKRFVQNGGTIVFNDANIFTTEVKYNPNADTITLVEGHLWKYDDVRGSAWPAEHERWLDENREWIGSNFLPNPTWDNVTFSNNPFHYNHTEEQYITNPDDKVILDFGAQINYSPTDHRYNLLSSKEQLNNNIRSNAGSGSGGEEPGDQQEVEGGGGIDGVYAKIGTHPHVAVYEHDYGRGKVISLSIFSWTLINNQNFFDFYQNEILPRALSIRTDSNQ